VWVEKKGEAMSAERKEWDGMMNMALVLAWSLLGGSRMREG